MLHLSNFMIYLFLILLYSGGFYYRVFGPHTKIVISVLLLVTGFSISIIGSYLDVSFGLILLLFGLYLFFQYTSKLKAGNLIIFNPNYQIFFILTGIIGIACTYYYNLFKNDSFGTNDIITFIFCMNLIFFTQLYKLNEFFTKFTTLTMFFLF